MEYTIFQKHSNTIIISIPCNASPPYHFLAESKANSRTSLFEEGAPDVGQNVSHEPTLYYSGPIYIGITSYCVFKCYNGGPYIGLIK